MLKGSILVELFRWMLQRSIVLTLVALVLTVGSALSVIYVTHLNRQLYSQLQDLQKHKKLLLEQSAWSEYSRVENLSESRLAMKTPAAGDVILVEYAKDSR